MTRNPGYSSGGWIFPVAILSLLVGYCLTEKFKAKPKPNLQIQVRELTKEEWQQIQLEADEALRKQLTDEANYRPRISEDGIADLPFPKFDPSKPSPDSHGKP